MSRKTRDDAFREVTGQLPARVKNHRRNHGKAAAERMRKAIALDRARSRGAKV